MTSSPTTSESGGGLVDLEMLRTKVDELAESGQMSEGLGLLEQLIRWPDSTRFLQDNVWLYARTGELYASEDRLREALEMYGRAFEFDPRALEVLLPYSHLLRSTGQREQSLRVVQAILLHHKRSLEPSILCEVYCQLGGLHEEGEDLHKAQGAYEKALDQVDQSPKAVEGLLRVVEAIGDPFDLIRVRERVIRGIDDNAVRAGNLVALGDDWVHKFNDRGRAIDVYEQALREDPLCVQAWERLSKVCAEIGEWRGAVRAFEQLADLAETPALKANYLLSAGTLSRDELWEIEPPLRFFRSALECDPNLFEAFKSVTSILVDLEDWEELERAYINFIAKHMAAETPNATLLTVLWQNLGDLYANHLSRPEDAAVSYHQASELAPQNREIHEKVIQLADVLEDSLDLAVQHARALLASDSQNWELADRLGRLFLRRKEIDQAWCVFRALSFVDYELSSKAQNFVEKYDQAMYREIKQSTPFSMLERRVFTPELSQSYSVAFHILMGSLSEVISMDKKGEYGIRRKDRVKLDANLMFTEIYQSIGRTLGHESLPHLWRKPDQVGLINGALVPAGMIVGDHMLRSGREEFTAFVIAKQLVLFMSSFYLASVRKIGDLRWYLTLANAVARPMEAMEAMETMGKDHRRVLKAIKRGTKRPDIERLSGALQRIEDNNLDLGIWLDAVEESANRVGLLFSDDLNACREYLEIEPFTVGSRSAEERMAAIVEYSLSEDYSRLRAELGIAIKD